MQRKLLASWIALALSLPLAYAHDGTDGLAGTPDTNCEVGADWADHDYGPPAAGLFIQGMQESNLEDCDGDFDPTNPICWVEEVNRTDVDGDTEVCDRFDDDLHSEYTRGGAWLLVNTGDGVTGGTELCFGRVGHHPNFGPVTAADIVFGKTVPFTVEADNEDATGLGDPCGDFQSDVSASCIDTCTVTFMAGLDGSYQVYVGFGAPGTQGHVCTPGGDCDLTIEVIHRPECSNGFDDDADRRTDWPRDPDCTDPLDDDESGNVPDPLPECADRIDNDDDDRTDWPNDPDCDGPTDTDESGNASPPEPPEVPECADGVDNADPEDTLVDWPNDPGCDDPLDDDETDNDGGPGVPFGGAPAAFRFNPDGSLSEFIEGPGWDCGTGPTNVGGQWVVECSPSISNPLVAASHPVTCRNPVANAGGTLVTIGSASASVACWTGFGFASSGTCTTTWLLAGGCTSRLGGVYHFPLRCSVSSGGVAVLGQFYAFCANDP